MSWSPSNPYLRPARKPQVARAQALATHSIDNKLNLFCLLLTLLGHIIAIAWLLKADAKTSPTHIAEAVLQVDISSPDPSPVQPSPSVSVSPAHDQAVEDINNSSDISSDINSAATPSPTPLPLPSPEKPPESTVSPIVSNAQAATIAGAHSTTLTQESSRYHPIKELTEKPRVLINIEQLELPGIEEQTLVLQLFIDEDGKIDKVELENAKLKQEHQQVVIASFSRMTFSPGKIDGRPVKSLLRIEVALEAHLPALGSSGTK